MEPSQSQGSAFANQALAGSQRELVGANVMLLSRLLRRSARSDFATFEPHSQMERRIVLMLWRIRQGRVSEMASLLGNDIAQVSRASRAMTERGLLQRDGPRAPFQLTAEGAELGRTMDVVALSREEELCRGFAPYEMFELAGIFSHLQQGAKNQLALEEERTGASMAPLEGPPVRSGAVDFSSRVHPAIIQLATTIMRTANIAYKRDTGLSSHEWRVLANVAGRPGIAFSELVNHIGSDKGQVHRSLDSLCLSGYLNRSRAGPGQPVRFALTPEGSAVHDVMLANARERTQHMLSTLDEGQRQRLEGFFARLISNATAMCERADSAISGGAS